MHSDIFFYIRNLQKIPLRPSAYAHTQCEKSTREKKDHQFRSKRRNIRLKPGPAQAISRGASSAMRSLLMFIRYCLRR